jgi:tetratricopeptide (TPR) repeat protein
MMGAPMVRLVLLLATVASVSCANDRPAWASQGAQDDPAQLRRAGELERTGKYGDAIDIYKELAAKDGPTAVASRRGLLRTLSEVGKYSDAEDAGKRFVGGPSGVELQNALGEVLRLRGKTSEAEAAFKAALGGRASDSLTARLNLDVLRYDRGEHADALRDLDGFIDIYNSRRRSLTSEELMAVGTACRYLGVTNPQLFKDALKAYDEAASRDTTNQEAQLRAVELFLDKYNSGDAKKSVSALLAKNPKHPRALLASARVTYFDGSGAAAEIVRKSLEVNPNAPAARAFLASIYFDGEDYAAAAREAEHALATDSTLVEAMSVLAAARYLQGDRAGFDALERRALAHNPKEADFFINMAEAAARNRLYAQAVDFAREGVAADSTAWRAYGVLGMNQLRVGAMDEGRKNLDRAFAGDPYDVWIKNTLDLLDTFKEYRETTSPRFRFVVDGKESELLSTYLRELAESAYDSLAARYQYRPPTPIRLEVYRSHADFSVRTVGLAGLGALGVSFGTTLAMDSPAARDAGDFNWGSTFWHELAHTFTLGASAHRVPRWLSEGLSVLEERRARKGWGADVTPEFLAAYKGGRLVKVSRMNDGFMRPAYPQQLIFSYYQASLVGELIERDFGPRAIVDMLSAYKSGATTEQVFQRVLKMSPEAFDAKFDAYIKERFGKLMAVIEPKDVRGDGAPRAPAVDGEYTATLSRGIAAFETKNYDEAIATLEKAKALFPEDASGQGPYWILAQIYKAKGNARAEANELTALTLRNEDNYVANVELARVLEQLGDSAGAAAALERAMFISPYDAPQHVRLASLYARLGNRLGAVRERQAVVALNPVDRAEALYQLALAYFEAGDGQAARREVLKALEDAPNFEKAQELLLRLQRANRSGGGGAFE